MNIAPDLVTKADIIMNAVYLANVFGIECPNVGILAAVELVDPRMPATLEAAALATMQRRGQFPSCHVDGPFALDNAVDRLAAEVKGIQSGQHPLQVLRVPGRRQRGRRAGGCHGPCGPHLAGGFGAGQALLHRHRRADGQYGSSQPAQDREDPLLAHSPTGDRQVADVRNLPNVLCALRIAMIPVLWVVAWHKGHWLFVGLLAATWFTDAIDGAIARRYHAESVLGSRLDSIADNLVQLSMVGWLYLLRPEAYTRYWYLIATLVFLFVLSMILQVRRKAALHTWANKATAWIAAAYLLYTFGFGVNAVATWVVFVTLGYALVEGCLLLLSKRPVDESTRSIWQRRPPAAAAGGKPDA